MLSDFLFAVLGVLGVLGVLARFGPYTPKAAQALSKLSQKNAEEFRLFFCLSMFRGLRRVLKTCEAGLLGLRGSALGGFAA